LASGEHHAGQQVAEAEAAERQQHVRPRMMGFE
jgi:hypothetical protein